MAAAAAGGGAGGSAVGGAVGGAAAGGLVGILSGLVEQEFVEKNLRKSQKYAQRMMQNRYQWARKDLEAAGLNPMLAFGGVPGGHAASYTGSPDFDMSGGDFAALPGRIADIKYREAETALATAQEAARRQDIATAKSQEELNRAAARTQSAVEQHNLASAGEARARTENLAQELQWRKLDQVQKEFFVRPMRLFNQLWEKGASSAEKLNEAGRKRQRELRGMTFRKYQEKHLLPSGPGPSEY